MADPRINLKNRTLAAALAFLVPGAGHWYQGRRFKAVIYFVCITGLFSWGMAMAEAKAVFFRWQEVEERLTPRKGKERTIGFLSQAMVGAPSLTAIVQWYRYSQTPELPNSDSLLAELPLDAPFHGFVKLTGANEAWEGTVTGLLQLRLESEADGRPFGPEVRGKFIGVRDADGQKMELSLAGPFEIAPRMSASSNVTFRLDGKSRPKEFASNKRYVNARVVTPQAEFDSPIGQVEGTIPRSFWNWFQVPVEDDAMQEMNRRLGKTYEIALLFTWVAGLLNLLAIWDAYEGPAYGYGDEVEQPDGQPNAPPPNPTGGVTAPIATKPA